MSKIHEIRVVSEGAAVASAAHPGPSTSVVLAILAEIETKLDALVGEGKDSTIDLRCLIGMPAELDLLRQILGQGEVAATVTTVGATLAQETAVPCVWWISHRDLDGGNLGEFVEITEVPDLLRSDCFSIAQGLAGLRIRCARLDTPDSHPIPVD
jgi:hydrogenase-1 operon protein HyaF